MKSHAEVIERLGGPTKLAQSLGVTPGLLTHWKRRGIPLKFWLRIEKTSLGREHGITADLLDGLANNKVEEL